MAKTRKYRKKFGGTWGDEVDNSDETHSFIMSAPSREEMRKRIVSNIEAEERAWAPGAINPPTIYVNPTPEQQQDHWLSYFLPWLVNTGFTPYVSLEYNSGYLTGTPRPPNRIRYNRQLLSNMLIIPIIPFDDPSNGLNAPETGVRPDPHIRLEPNNDSGNMGSHITLYYTLPSLLRGSEGAGLQGPITMHIYRNKTINFNIHKAGERWVYRPSDVNTIDELLSNNNDLITFKIASDRNDWRKRIVTFPRHILEQINKFITDLDTYISMHGPIPYSYRHSTRGGKKTRKQRKQRKQKTKGKKSKARKSKRVKRKTHKYR